MAQNISVRMASRTLVFLKEVSYNKTVEMPFNFKGKEDCT